MILCVLVDSHFTILLGIYQLWTIEKGREATRRSLLDALRAITQNNVADTYEDYLKTMVSYLAHISMYTCT